MHFSLLTLSSHQEFFFFRRRKKTSCKPLSQMEMMWRIMREHEKRERRQKMKRETVHARERGSSLPRAEKEWEILVPPAWGNLVQLVKRREKENDSEGPLFREGKRLLNYMLLSSACEYEGQEWNSSLSFTKERVDNMVYLLLLRGGDDNNEKDLKPREKREKTGCA